MGGGIGINIIPDEVWATFDMRIRLRPDLNFTDIENMLDDIVTESRLGSTDPNDVTLEYSAKSMEAGESVADESNVWCRIVQDACREMNVTCEPAVLSAATDARFVRTLDIPAFGIGPFLNTPSTAHQVNEFINEVEFLNGIGRYETLIKHLTRVPGSLHV